MAASNRSMTETGLAGYRVPKQVEFGDSIPETMLGKVLRRVLVEEERAKAEASSADSEARPA